MLRYTTEQLASVVALPIVTILLVWTTAIFQRNRASWGPYDIPVVSLLILSILRNLTVLAYTLFVALNQNTIDVDYCSVVVWIFNSIHTFQASSLTTLVLIGLFSVKLHRKRQRLLQFLTATHVIYHLFCVTTLCACVGVAAILAQHETSGNFKNFTVFDTNPCKFMPFDLDIKYNVFIIVLNVFLASVSVIAFLATCFNQLKIKQSSFDYLKKSNSDLSDLSLGINVNSPDHKNYYDTYTIQRNHPHHHHQLDQPFYEGQNNNIVWNSDVSNISTTVSSTNSRRPCINQQPIKEEENRTGLETIHPVLIVCYLFYHLPIIILCIYPDLVAPWPIAGVALWLGLVQDLLIPIGLSIVDSRFCKWVSNVYKCSNTHGGDKLPHVGLDGKFRPFSSPPQSLDPSQTPHRAVEHRFPITNGSLYTSIDGRLPVIHNYRRKPITRPRDFFEPQQPSGYNCQSCVADLCPSHSNLHHLSPQYMNKQLKLAQGKRTSVSQESLRYLQPSPPQDLSRSQRLCKSQDSIHEISKPQMALRFQPPEKKQEQILDYSSSEEDFTDHNQNFDTLSSTSSYSITTEANCDFDFFQSKDKSSKMMSTFKPLEMKNNTPSKDDNFVQILLKDNQCKIQRSNSYMTLEDRQKKKKLLRSNSKLSDCTHNIRQKIKSVEYLPSSNASTVFIEDVFYFNYPNQRQCGGRSYVGSVPDLKKVFISEYI